MKKRLVSILLVGFIGFPCWLWAQADSSRNTEQEEIVILKKGKKAEPITIEIVGDNVTINGKPMNEYQGNNVTVKKRKSLVMRDGVRPRIQMFRGEGMPFEEEMIEENSAPKAFLGVLNNKNEKGAQVTEVVKGSAAEKAGIREGDIITKVDKETITDAESLAKAVGAKKPKDEVKISFLREGKSKTEKVTLGERPAERRRMIFKMPKQPGEPELLTDDFIGDINGDFKIELDGNDFPGGRNLDIERLRDFNFDWNPSGRKKLGLKLQDTEAGNGVQVIDVEDDSPAAKAGLQKDDLLTEINGQKMTNTDEAREQLKSAAEKSEYQMMVTRKGSPIKITVKIPKKLKTVNL